MYSTRRKINILECGENMAKRGRKPIGFKPEIDERKKWLAADFLNLIQTYYTQMMEYDPEQKIIDWDLWNDTILLTHRSILYNGIDTPVYVTKDTPEKQRLQIYKNKFYISYQTNYTSMKGKEPKTDEIRDSMPTEDPLNKIERDMRQDAKAMAILDLAYELAEPITYYCFRLYYLIPNMSYAKLKQITKVNDCKKRVVGLRKLLQENIESINHSVTDKMSGLGF